MLVCALLIMVQSAVLLLQSYRLTGPQTLVPDLLQHGFHLYTDITVQYPPGYLWLTELLATILPDSNIRLRISAVALGVITTTLVYLVTRSDCGKRAANMAVLHSVIWQCACTIYPFYFDAVVGLLGLAAVASAKRPVVAGLCLAAATLVKPYAIVMALGFGVYYLWQDVSVSALRSRFSLPQSLWLRRVSLTRRSTG